MIRGILFDKDDTLVDLAAFWREPVRRTALWLAERRGRAGDTALANRLASAAGFDGGVLRPGSPVAVGTNWQVMDACGGVLAAEGLNMDPALREEGASYLEMACIRYGDVVGKADLRTLLPALRRRGLRLGVATSDHYGSAMHCLRRLGIETYFDLILAADCVREPKPAPEMARRFCEACGISPEETAVVGDSGSDMRFAQNSGLTGILLREDPAGPLPEGTGYVISHLHQLPALLDRL